MRSLPDRQPRRLRRFPLGQRFGFRLRGGGEPHDGNAAFGRQHRNRRPRRLRIRTVVRHDSHGADRRRRRGRRQIPRGERFGQTAGDRPGHHRMRLHDSRLRPGADSGRRYGRHDLAVRQPGTLRTAVQIDRNHHGRTAVRHSLSGRRGLYARKRVGKARKEEICTAFALNGTEFRYTYGRNNKNN